MYENRHNRYWLFSLCMCLLLSISASTLELRRPQPALSFAYQASDCLNMAAMQAKDSGDDCDGIDLVVVGNTLYMTHYNAEYNCCADMVVHYQLQGNIIKFIEVETFGEYGPCECLCMFELSAQLGGLSSGDYIVKVQDQYGYCYCTKEIHISNLKLKGRFARVSYLQSGCLPMGKGDDMSLKCVNWEQTCDNFEFISNGSTLDIIHRCAFYNCCAILVPQVSVDGYTITVVELETFDEMGPCYCMCFFNFTTSIRYLNPGVYTVTIMNQQGEVYCQAEVEM